MFSILPSGGADEWDDPLSCSRLFSQGAVRFGYGEGTSFAAPLVSGLAALVWQVQPRLASEQVAHVLTRTARQTVGTQAWNEYTGAGVVDGGAAMALARVYDLTAPPKRGSAHRRDGSQRGGAHRARTRPHPRRPRAGRAREVLDPGVARRRQELRRGAAPEPADQPPRAPQGQPDQRDRHRGLRPQRQLRDQAAGPVPAATRARCAACAVGAGAAPCRRQRALASCRGARPARWFESGNRGADQRDRAHESWRTISLGTIARSRLQHESTRR